MTASNEMKTLGALIAGEVPPMPKVKAPKETAAERRARQAAETAAYWAEKERVTLENRNSRAGKLLELLAMAQQEHMTVRLSATPENVVATFVVGTNEGYGYHSENTQVVSLASEDSDVEDMFVVFQRLDDERKEAHRVQEVARQAFDALTEEQRKALGLTRRP